jgi:hypothetical protein
MAVHPIPISPRARSRFGRAFDGRLQHGTALALVCLAIGALAGTVGASVPMAVRSPHQEGACMALHMAAAHGYLDERQQRVVMRALATATNPNAHLFPGGYSSMQQACAE